MRSKRFCTLAEGVVLAALAVLPSDAQEKKTVRLRVSVDDLPREDGEGKLADPTKAVLPDGAKHGGTVPRSWHRGTDDWQDESSRCTSDRHAAIETIRSDGLHTDTIFTGGDGKTYLDSAYGLIKEGKIQITQANRLPLVRITDGLWGMRRKDTVVLVAAADEGINERATFYGCTIQQSAVASPAGTFVLSSSAEEAERVRKELGAKGPKWVGVDRIVRGSVSQSSADPTPMLNLLVTTPSRDSP